jgi:succinyl-diaminopimelate desuccinylase
VTPELAERLAARTLELVRIPSAGRDDRDILQRIRELVPSGAFELADVGDGVLFFLPRSRRSSAQLIVLAGHVDTVPANGNVPGRFEASSVVGRGASDMKGALAVMLELAAAVSAEAIAGDLDAGLLFFGREELPIGESAILPLFARCPGATAVDLAIVMEPTGNTIEVGCLGNLTAAVTVYGRAAHSARPWLGSNAIHHAIRALAPLGDLPVRDVELDGLVFREVVSVTTIVGGIAPNVVPDRVRAEVNVRYAPSHTPAEAESRLRELLSDPDVQIEIMANAPPAPVVVANPLVRRLRDVGTLDVGPKQAWTPVAEFATVGVDAINFGPGDPRYAHRDDERVEVAALVRSYEVVRAFLLGSRAGEGRS